MEAAPNREMASRYANAGHGDGVRDLMRAVLLDAILCLRASCGPQKLRQQLALDAHFWMVSTARNWPFSFENICDVLGINPSYLRTLLLSPRESLEGTRSAAAAAAEEVVRKLSTLRMRGNQRTHIRPKRQYKRRKRNGL